MRDLSDVVVKPSDFHALSEMCYLDPAFPRDFNAWSDLIALADSQARERHLFPAPLLIEPADFREWCARMSIVPSIDALRAYAIVQRSRSPVAG